VHLGLLIAPMNDLEIVAADVGNANLNADCQEKIWFIAGPEFGTKKGKVLIIRKALYGLKSSGAAWRALFSSTLHELGYTPSKGNPDVYLHPAVKANGTQYCEMLLVCVDDILHITTE
jgi:Reverse transcriptase (RNA-dependent DNA polymerase)